MAANNRAIKTTINTQASTLTIATEKGDFVVELAKLSPEILKHAALHGLKQKIVDAAAMGAGATITDKYEAMQEVVERLTSAEATWNKGNIGAGGGAKGGLLFKALCRMYPDKDPETVRNYHNGLDKSQQAALRKNAKIAGIIEEIKAESVNTKGIDSDELLSGLEGAM